MKTREEILASVAKSRSAIAMPDAFEKAAGSALVELMLDVRDQLSRLADAVETLNGEPK